MEKTILLSALLLVVAIVVTFVCRYLEAKKNGDDVKVEKLIIDSALSTLERGIYTAVVATNEEFTKLYKKTDGWTEERKAEARELALEKVFASVNESTLESIELVVGDLDAYIKDRILATVNDINAQSPWK